MMGQTRALVVVRASSGLPAVSAQIADVKAYLQANQILLDGIVDLALAGTDPWTLLQRTSEERAALPCVVVLWGVDCLMPHLATFTEYNAWLGHLGQRGIGMASVRDGLRLSAKENLVAGQIAESWSLAKANRKKENALMTVAKAKERGSWLGRNKKRDDRLILDLRSKGHTIREIAALTNVSPTVVQRVLSAEA